MISSEMHVKMHVNNLIYEKFKLNISYITVLGSDF